MDIELENKLFSKYPTLFPGGRNVDPNKSLIFFGIECGNGWYNLIDELMSKILELDKGCIVVQVKQKFGGLRVYIEPTNDKPYDLIIEYEAKSYLICEECGKYGELRNDRSYVKTLCKGCNKQ